LNSSGTGTGRSKTPRHCLWFIKGTDRTTKRINTYFDGSDVQQVSIGEYAMIGSGAVVTKDVPQYSLVVGKVDKKGFRV